jgi:hypothetical protein
MNVIKYQDVRIVINENSAKKLVNHSAYPYYTDHMNVINYQDVRIVIIENSAKKLVNHSAYP